MFDIDVAIEGWKKSFGQDGSIDAEVVMELETHLRELITDLGEKGLSSREAFLVGTDRLGHPAELECEFAKTGPASMWRKRVLWMLAGYIAITVGGAIVSTIAGFTSIGMAVSGMGGNATGAVMVAVQALGWIGLISLLFRQSQKVGFGGDHFPVKWVVIAGMVLIAAPLVTAAGQFLQIRLIDMAQYGQSLVWNSIGGWAIHLGVCVACLVLIFKLSEPLTNTAESTA